jgi:hypothetical protein
VEKTRTKLFQEMLESKGVSRSLAKQAAVTINNDLCGERTERGQRQVWKAWNQSQDQSQADSAPGDLISKIETKDQSQENG